MAQVDTKDAELIRRAIESRLADVHVAMPGFVESYDPATRTASIKLGVKQPILSVTDRQVEEDLPLLQNVRVIFPGCNALDTHFVLAPGDGVLCVFCSRAIAELRTTGAVSAPGDQRMHSLSHAVAFPGWDVDANPGQDTDNSIGVPGGLRIHFGAGALSVGGGVDFVAMSESVSAQFQKIVDLFANWTPVPNDGGAALKAASASLMFDSVASSNLKAD